MRRRSFLKLLGGAAAALVIELQPAIVTAIEEAANTAGIDLNAEVAAYQDIFEQLTEGFTELVFGESPFLHALSNKGKITLDHGEYEWVRHGARFETDVHGWFHQRLAELNAAA